MFGPLSLSGTIIDHYYYSFTQLGSLQFPPLYSIHYVLPLLVDVRLFRDREREEKILLTTNNELYTRAHKHTMRKKTFINLKCFSYLFWTDICFPVADVKFGLNIVFANLCDCMCKCMLLKRVCE